MMAQLPDSMRAMGYGGFGYMIDSVAVVTRGKPVAHTVSRLRVAGRDKYRIDYLTRSGRNRAKTIACDGEHRWVVFAAQIMVRPTRCRATSPTWSTRPGCSDAGCPVAQR